MEASPFKKDITRIKSDSRYLVYSSC